MATVEIEATDVIRLMLQFLKEQSLTASLQALQEEAQVAREARERARRQPPRQGWR